MASETRSIVEYFGIHEGYSCGYCKKSDSNYSHGMWAHAMSPMDYQNLVDRGWRRSGKYCYKPTMSITCCPQYTIRCEALRIKLSKSQKNVIKKMNKYLNTGSVHKVYSPCAFKASSSSEDSVEHESGEGNSEWKAAAAAESKVKYQKLDAATSSTTADKPKGGDAHMQQKETKSHENMDATENASPELDETHLAKKFKKTPKPGLGPDPAKPVCKKAKMKRREMREKKQEAQGKPQQSAVVRQSSKPPNPPNHAKTIEDFLSEVEENPVHNLEVSLVRSCPPSAEFERTEQEAYELYKRYQTEVHREIESDCDKKSYRGFLVESPLEHETPPDAPSCGYGSFHQQYRLDDKLVAVGVIDVLPHCVSSVYFFYDPDYAHLTFGTYASLRELAFTRELQKQAPDLQYYYLGFYIHSCPKMRYKGQYSPSYLLCPETYTWHPIDECRSKLDESKYSRLESDEKKSDRNYVQGLHEIPVVYRHQVVNYFRYLRLNSRADDEAEVRQYADLVGRKCAYTIILFRS